MSEGTVGKRGREFRLRLEILTQGTMKAKLLGAASFVKKALGRQVSLLTHLRAYSQFKLASLVFAVAFMAVLGPWVEWLVTSRVINQTGRSTAAYVEALVGPELQDLARLGTLPQARSEKLDALLKGTLVPKRMASLRVWDRRGRILYSTISKSIGHVYPADEKLAGAFEGRIYTGVSSLDEAEHADEQDLASQLLEVYVPVRPPGGGPVVTVVEFFLRLDGLEGEIARARTITWIAFSVSVLLVFLVIAAIFRRADRTIEKQAADLQSQVTYLAEVVALNAELGARVREAAASVTTLHERLLKRVGAELHDGPAQDQSFVLMRLDNVVTRAERCLLIHSEGKTCLEELQVLRGALDHSLQELRAISAGLGLASLGDMTLAATLKRAVRAHERRTGTTVAVDLGVLPEELPLPAKITFFRVVQEALNNAFRHAGGIGQELRAWKESDEVVLEVTDRGPGFDVKAVMGLLASFGDHLGLVGMRDRIESLGGTFSVESKPGEGTKVRARLAADAGRTSHV